MVTTVFASGRSRGAGRSTSKPTQRLDIQGLRMVAVMLVVLSHLFHWPQGGFIGVDVFFVISGFLITGSLLHTFEKTGRISFSSFYRRRIRRIVPAATLVLLATSIAAYTIFTEARFKTTILDAVWAFFFVSNWRFGIEGTDYFNATGPVSPLQHYWSLSVEEQFYFVWPAVILAIGLVVTRQAWSRRARLALSAAVMSLVVAASFAYSVFDTATDPTWAYFSTLTRVWELGVGALLAITISYFERIPDSVRPLIAWTGLLAIILGAFAISETEGGFPAPWAAVPVLGAVLVIAAGVRGPHRYLQVLTNNISTYIGDISYSLYLWHWPVIILLGAVMDANVYFYVSALLLMFGFSIAAYHFFENPIRNSRWLINESERADRRILDLSRWRLPSVTMTESDKTIAIGSLALITAGIASFALVPPKVTVIPGAGYTPVGTAAEALTDPTQSLGPAQTEVASQITTAVSATSWPDLSPSMDDAIAGPQAPTEILRCGNPTRLSPSDCTWGSPAAPKTMVLVGDSMAMTYAQPLKNFAEASGGQWKVRVEAMFGCRFADLPIQASDNDIARACPQHRSNVIQTINDVKPTAVVISNNYTSEEASVWTDAMTRFVDQFRTNTGSVFLLAAPPTSFDITKCYTRTAQPADCVGQISDQWTARASAEARLADRINGEFVDSRQWFCTSAGYCPSFVGSTPTKRDRTHMTPAYGALISPAVAERLHELGL
ncbi:acyltransferase family protein [Rhodococcus sp. A5(2022)]|uniref:acyltransferase family protein n=1 Tax=Rhodococcus sp. A5(2022) TaxID=3003588 RepID=UPI0022A887BE|nr:acyltransferase family protein [Rhodococcus sp. A5(2022)]MCZ1075107.1 acyltransferase family protein [Rhodococcus sp. A5(2022)]